MVNSIFYTFSTISQTLAGAIGLLAAFLLFHLSQLDQRIRRHLETLYSRYPRATETVDLDFIWEAYSVPDLLDYFEKDRLDYLSAGEGTDKAMYLRQALTLWKARQVALAQTRNALAWTAAVILFALAMLALADVVARWQIAATVALATGIAAAGWCLWLYGRLVLTVART